MAAVSRRAASAVAAVLVCAGCTGTRGPEPAEGVDDKARATAAAEGAGRPSSTVALPATSASGESAASAAVAVAYTETDNTLRWVDARGRATGRALELGATPADVTACDGSINVVFRSGDIAALSAKDGRQTGRARVAAATREGLRDLAVEGVICSASAVYVYGSVNRPPSDVFETFVDIRSPRSLAPVSDRLVPRVVQDASSSPSGAALLLDDGRVHDARSGRTRDLPFAAAGAQDLAARHGGDWVVVKEKAGEVLRTPAGRAVTLPAGAGVTDVVSVDPTRALVLLGNVGQVRLVDRQAATVWSAAVDGLPYAAAVVGGTVLVGAGNSDALTALDLKTGTVLNVSRLTRGVVRITALA